MRLAAASVRLIRFAVRSATRVEGAIRVTEPAAWCGRSNTGALQPHTPASTSLSLTA
ncbi:Uncharacterised protein [Bordetella pertussis]|nr:Uncharacterised protein [Bordetella pertussis]CFL94142.1 Uncharacterised protein [Bordetella pertussis]CFM15918.1 Uncharacterised protein [Bordetella pertussis]CFM33914.1 Uncharacterised protein [Bordetella pertussis]CFM45106.1 Uncharacterised protein [Bordetella pertussis]